MGRESRSPPGTSVYMLERVVPVQVTAGVKVMRLEESPHHQEAREAGRGPSRQVRPAQ